LKQVIQSVVENPVIAKELRGRMRGRQAFILVSLYLLLISAILVLIYLIATIDSGTTYRWTPEFRQGLGKALFGTVILMELLMIPFIAPGLTSGAIAAEREHRTLDLLRTTLLSARSLVLGKLGAAFAFLLLLIVAAMPLESIAFMLGGVGMEELLISTLLLIVTAIYFCTLGLFFSSVMKRVLTATVSSYASIVLGILGLVVVYFLVLLLESSSYSYTGAISNPNPFWTNLLSVITWVLLSTNPLMAAIMSEVLLVDQQQLFFTTDPFSSNSGLILPAPWLIYTVIMLVLTAIMISISVRAVKRPDR
jgi:ABC-type transport system involved in multi-copper enzyme maturation permease subunit